MSSPNLSIPSLFNVDSKVALVTGGASGIGLMIATALVQNGVKVYISSRKEKELKKVSEALSRKGPGSCHYLCADLSSRAGCDSLATAFTSVEAQLHILVNNSGVTWGGAWDDFPEVEGWDKVMNVNVKALFYLTSALTPILSRSATPQDHASVINIGSVAGVDPRVEMGGVAGEGVGPWSYSVSKSAVHHLTSIQAVVLGPKRITVNAVLPGLFESRMTKLAVGVFGDQLRAAQPTKRYGQASDIGGTVIFLASRAGAHVTGAHIRLDGGATLAGTGGFKTADETSARL